MPAFVRPDDGRLVVSFARCGEPIENQNAQNAEEAWSLANHMLTKRHPQLRHGDFLFIRGNDDPPPPHPIGLDWDIIPEE
jgi:hypothetical protein